jgi:hypothetical protein
MELVLRLFATSLVEARLCRQKGLPGQFSLWQPSCAFLFSFLITFVEGKLRLNNLTHASLNCTVCSYQNRGIDKHIRLLELHSISSETQSRLLQRDQQGDGRRVGRPASWCFLADSFRLANTPPLLCASSVGTYGTFVVPHLHNPTHVLQTTAF